MQPVGRSVTGVCITNTGINGQIPLENRFHLLQDIEEHVFHNMQASEKSRVTSTEKQSKVITNQILTPQKVESQNDTNVQNSKDSSENSVAQKLSTSLHRDSHSGSWNVSQIPEGDDVDIDSHVTDLHLAINGKCYIDNRNHCKSKPSSVMDIDGRCQPAGMCVEKQCCISQTGGNFGFVPETPLKLYEGPTIHWKKVPSILQAHALVKNSGTHNCLKCRIPVNSHLNIERWQDHLQ